MSRLDFSARRRVDHHVEILRQADVAGMQHDEPIVQAVGARKRVVFRRRHDRRRVGPVVNHGHLRGVGALAVDQPRRHRVAEGDDPRRAPHEKAIHAIQQRVDERTAKILEQAGDLRKDVLAEEHHAAPRPRGQRRQADDRRIGQGDRHVLARQAQRRSTAPTGNRSRSWSPGRRTIAARTWCRARAGCGRRCAARTRPRRGRPGPADSP